MKEHNKTVYVGVSGGVDSSVSAALLQKQGYKVIGVFIRTWQPDFIECTWREERRDAMRVCAHLRIPFVELDLEEEYKKGVADYMISEYQKGRTPNPDVMCNREVKFGGFLSWAKEQGADYVATGHYAQVTTEDGITSMLRGVDNGKDQTYFLWTLTQEQLQHTLFPIGHLPKSEVRKLAERYELPTATKKDSQGICFIGDIDMKDFLSHYLDIQEGNLLNTEGEIIGTHDGSLLYTTGERRGFHIDPKYKTSSDAPYFVVSKDVENNTVTVSQEKVLTQQLVSSIVELKEVVDNQRGIHKGEKYSAQFRYHGAKISVSVKEYDVEKKILSLELLDPVDSIAQGQSVVMYRGNVCLGGGIIS